MTRRVVRGAAAADAPPAGWASGPLGRAQAADREIARQTALKARALAEFAATRPASDDRPQGQRGAMSADRWASRSTLLREVSEWAAQEAVIALSVSHQAAETQLERALVLARRLPATLDALESGAIHTGHLWPLIEHVAPIEDAVKRAECEAELLAWMAGRVTTPAQLGAKTRRLLLARDARSAGRRLAAALKERGIHLRAEPTPGMASVTTVMTMPEAQMFYRAMGDYADGLEDDPDGEPRTRGQKMVDCLLDLVLRPGETDLPPVQVLLTIVASMATVLGGDEPGEVDGHVIPAEMVRHLLHALAGRTGGLGGDDLALPDDAGLHDDAGPVDDAGPTEEPVDQPAGPTSPAQDHAGPGDPVEDPDLAARWEGVEHRLRAGDLPDEPDPVPEDVLRRWAEEVLTEDGEGGSWHRSVGEEPPDPVPDEVLQQWAAGATACLWSSPAAARLSPVGRSSAPGSSWWVVAEGAVSAAGLAVRSTLDAVNRARHMVHNARMADLADEEAWSTTPAGRVSAAADALAALDDAAVTARRDLADLLDSPAGGFLADRPRIAVVDALSGTLLALSDLPALRRAGSCGAAACSRRPEACSHDLTGRSGDLTGRSGLGPPGPTAGYRPGRELDRWVRARDRRCRFPGCRRRVPRSGELDHHVPHPDGPTSAANLAGYCTADHRCKHQAPGWVFELEPDGTVTITTPTGMTTSTDPPPY